MVSHGKLNVLLVVLSSLSRIALAASAPPLVNWKAPPTYTPSVSQSKIRTLTDISSPLPFIATAPCRQYNSLSASPLAQGVNRVVPLTGSPCGIPSGASGAVAVSVNITVFNITGAIGNGVFKVDTVTPPAVAWINYPPTEAQRGNAGVVALNASGQIVVQVAQGAGQVDFIVDVNGYYAGQSASGNGLFVISTSPAIAIFGLATGTGVGTGVSGQTNTTGNGSVGVYGFAFTPPGGGYTFGVFGKEFSEAFGSAGVKGQDWSGSIPAPSYAPAGVRGDSNSNSGYGVLGVSQFQGVAGSVVNGSGAELAYGLLGFNIGTVYGVFAGGNFGGTGAKYFVEPHPTDPSQVIRYVALEGPEAGTYFRGRGKFQSGAAVIEVPEDFRMVTDSEGLSVQVTPIGDFANIAVVRIELDGIVVKASRNVEFFYTVSGVRKTHKDLKPIGPGNEFAPRSADARMPAYLTEGQKAMLISNGTYREDGTVNMATAERVGWTKIWAEQEAQRQAAREANMSAGAGQK